MSKKLPLTSKARELEARDPSWTSLWFIPICTRILSMKEQVQAWHYCTKGPLALGPCPCHRPLKRFFVFHRKSDLHSASQSKCELLQHRRLSRDLRPNDGGARKAQISSRFPPSTPAPILLEMRDPFCLSVLPPYRHGLQRFLWA